MTGFTLFDLFLPATVALLVTLVTTPLMILLAKRFHLIDDPKTHKHPGILHTKPTPRGGGVPIALGIVIASLLFLPIEKPLLLILLGGIVTVIIGILDDKYDLSPYTRFVSNFLVASLPVIGGISVFFITNPLGSGVISFEHIVLPFGFFGKETIVLVADLLSLVWIVWTMNMLNWSTGVNGQMPGIAAIAATTIGILSLRFSPLDQANVTTAKLSFIVAASALAFLPFNFPKARIFPGYSGTIIGFMLAVLSILSGAKVATALLVMAVPTIDALFTILRRLSKRRSPFRGDRGHLHHLLIQRGFQVWQIALLYWGFSAVLGTTALLLSSQQKFFAIIVLVVITGGGLLWLSLFSKQNEREIKE